MQSTRMPRSPKKKKKARKPRAPPGDKSASGRRRHDEPAAPEDPTEPEEPDELLRRRCDGRACCQARTASGNLCRRPAILNGETYNRKLRCCLVCWQHARIYGACVAAHALDKGCKLLLPPAARRDLKAMTMALDGV